jgi:hypothetical protein
MTPSPTPRARGTAAVTCAGPDSRGTLMALRSAASLWCARDAETDTTREDPCGGTDLVQVRRRWRAGVGADDVALVGALAGPEPAAAGLLSARAPRARLRGATESRRVLGRLSTGRSAACWACFHNRCNTVRISRSIFGATCV